MPAEDARCPTTQDALRKGAGNCSPRATAPSAGTPSWRPRRCRPFASGIFQVRFWLFLLGALTAGIFWIGIYVGVSYFLGEEIAKLVGKIGTKALIGVIVLVVVGLLIRAGVSKWRGARQARLAD